VKLELKHLAPYLPYGLKLSYWGDRKDIRSLAVIDLYPSLIKMWNDRSTKPLLRPLSDLALSSSPLTIVDLNRMRGVAIKNSEYDVIVDDGECIICKWAGIYSFYLERQTMSFYDNSTSGISPQFDMFQKLFEYHFDVFGLIPAGLAIDINTLKS